MEKKDIKYVLFIIGCVSLTIISWGVTYWLVLRVGLWKGDIDTYWKELVVFSKGYDAYWYIQNSIDLEGIGKISGLLFPWAKILGCIIYPPILGLAEVYRYYYALLIVLAILVIILSINWSTAYKKLLMNRVNKES